MKRIRIHQVILLGVVGIFLIGCTTFKGDIPVAIEMDDTIYISPKNQDGIQDALTIPVDVPAVKGLFIKGYRLTVSDSAGSPVRVIENILENPKKGVFGNIKEGVEIPEMLQWDGTDDEGGYVADGEYGYQISAWDYRNNKGVTVPLYVVVDNTPPYLELTAPYLFFSPNGDGRQEVFPVNQRQSSEEGQWIGQFRDPADGLVKQLIWNGQAQDASWDGKNETGSASPDGIYTYQVASTDLAGNTGVFTLNDITIDTALTPIRIETDLKVFSPNGDGKKDTIRFLPNLQVSRNVVEWQIEVNDEKGSIIRNLSGKGAVPESVAFDGKRDSGQSMADGRYIGMLSVVYMNGDNPQIASPWFTVDNTPPRIALNADYLLFSPEGDGRKDTVTIWQSSSVEDLWEGQILDSTGKSILQRSWKQRAAAFNWDGKDAGGKIVLDGLYTYRANATDAADNVTVTELKGIQVDTRPTPVKVALSAASFSPNGSGVQEFVSFDLSVTVPDRFLSWDLDVVDQAGKPVRRFIGLAALKPPANIVWDGKNNDGIRAAEGRYFGIFRVSYEKGNLVEARTPGSVLLDISGPQITLGINPRPFSPDGDGVDDTVTITAGVKDDNPIAGWTARILDPAGNLFTSFTGQGEPKQPIAWNGKSPNGELVQAASDYKLSFTARDNLGNSRTAEDLIPVDILVQKIGDQLKIVISSIYFKPNTADYTSIEPDKVAANLKTLDRLAEILKRYSQYVIRVEGHAVREYWNFPNQIQREETEELQPLSTDRATTIKEALVERGVRADRMSIRGFGGTRPVVPHGDLANRWKNRRVEFILIK